MLASLIVALADDVLESLRLIQLFQEVLVDRDLKGMRELQSARDQSARLARSTACAGTIARTGGFHSCSLGGQPARKCNVQSSGWRPGRKSMNSSYLSSCRTSELFSFCHLVFATAGRHAPSHQSHSSPVHLVLFSTGRLRHGVLHCCRRIPKSACRIWYAQTSSRRGLLRTERLLSLSSSAFRRPVCFLHPRNTSRTEEMSTCSTALPSC